MLVQSFEFSPLVLSSQLQWMLIKKFQVKILAEKFRFRVNIKPETTWGEFLPNGTLIGSIGSVSIFLQGNSTSVLES